MGRIVQGIGMSHSPMMALEGVDWKLYTTRDLNHPLLFDETGKHVSYDVLDDQRKGRYKSDVQPEKLAAIHDVMEKGFARLKADIKEAADIMVVITNDHPGEFFDGTNIPAFAVFHGDRLISADEKKRLEKLNATSVHDPESEAFRKQAEKMGMDKNHIWPGSLKLGEHLTKSLINQGIDVSVLKEPKNSAWYGHGHGIGMVVTKLMDEDHLIPIVPIYLNTEPPNIIPSSRCYDIGLALRKAVETYPGDLRVCIVASGGLSHFVTDVGLDEQVLNALRNRSEQDLRNLPDYRLTAGNSEIRNWVMLSAATEHLSMVWDQYTPVFRTPAGTGIGITFARWS